MRLVLMDGNGTVLDSTDEFTREEFDNLSPAGAYALIGDLYAGAK